MNSQMNDKGQDMLAALGFFAAQAAHSRRDFWRGYWRGAISTLLATGVAIVVYLSA